MKHFARIDWKTAALTALLAAGGSAACSEGNDGPDTPPGGEATPYVTQVFDYRPAVGQFVNELPEYEEGDTQETMNRKALEAIGNNNQGMVSLGGFGGYIVVGFDHTIENKAGLCDFRVQGNAFYANGQSEYGSSEPGVIEVSFDANGNGLPDDEWYEIAGSSYNEGGESWIEQAREAGNDVRTIRNYEITYYRPATEPGKPTEEYIRWEDNQGESGYKAMNSAHLQSYYPQWIDEEQITFSGTRLPQNGIDLSGVGNNFALYKFAYGYADNEPNTSDRSAIDIDWAVDADGQPANLPGVDFIRIHTGVNQENGWLGECSTEIMGVVDLHLTEVRIESNTIKQ
ncbi:PKD domain-containing protein [uncultured Alistipes sp.]|uniref:PKD domain-containing protein n=1 Tax=uncultured Alistipes sp. TaxID=538949 RepID=UPI0026104279|nr:PKD domain-containing protein [uncultured Alistipes sp.]